MEITMEVNDIILKAYEYAKDNNDEFITAEHILYGATFNDVFIEAVKECNGSIDSLRHLLEDYIKENVEKKEDVEPIQSYSFQQILLIASQQVIFSEGKAIGIEHIISAFYDLKDSFAHYFLEEEGITKRDILINLTHKNSTQSILSDESVDEHEKNMLNKERKETLLSKLTVDLTEQAKESDELLIGRDDILERTIQILCRKNKNNPIHIGEPGVGKTAITLGLAKLINEGKVPERLKDSKIFSLDIGSALAGTKYRGDFEERIKKVLDEIKKCSNPIVYIDEIHTIVGAGSLGGGSLDASNLLKPYLMEGKVKFIGATTFEEYKKYFEKDKALSRRFQTIEVKETTVDETIKIIDGIINNFEEYHNVKYTKKAIEEAVSLSHKYINDKFLPDKAIDIIDEAGAYVATNNLNDNIIHEGIIEEVISKTCSIPKNTVENNEIDSLKNLECNLKEKIFGQDLAIESVTKCIKMSRAGLNDENKPIASLLFVGPTGVGKTEIAKSLSEELNIKLIRFDMSEYTEKHAAAKLIGAPPGYVGYEEGGLLTEAIRKNPNCVLLLDEIEKAHNDIISVLLQVMDYATLTDNQGRKADFRNVILIMTSNAGAKDIGKNLVGFGDREVKGTAIMEEVKRFFTPEFRNRLDKIVVFNHLNEKIAYNIANKELKLFSNQLVKKNVDISFDETLITYIAKEGTSKEFGAREIKRIIGSKIKPLLVDEILFGKLSNGGSCTITYIDNSIQLNIN